MSVSILLITHAEVGYALLKAATKTLGELPLQAQAITVEHYMDPDKLLLQLRALTHDLDTGDGILILTDLFGATPFNLARRLQEDEEVEVELVAGLNLPMLIRVMNYPDLDLLQLAQKAFSGGRDGVQAQTYMDVLMQ
jgi:PTS system ascorbate-specific IIA component